MCIKLKNLEKFSMISLRDFAKEALYNQIVSYQCYNIQKAWYKLSIFCYITIPDELYCPMSYQILAADR